MARYVVLEDTYLAEIDLRLKADERIEDGGLPDDVLNLLWAQAVIDIDRGDEVVAYDVPELDIDDSDEDTEDEDGE